MTIETNGAEYREREQGQGVVLAETEPTAPRPIDRLRQLLREAQTDHLEFIAPDNKRLLLSTDRYYEDYHLGQPLPEEHEVVVAIGRPQDRLRYPYHEFEECFWFKKEGVEIQADQAKLSLDSQFLGHIEMECKDEFLFYNETENWQGQEYDRLVNRVFDLIRQSTPLPLPAQQLP